VGFVYKERRSQRVKWWIEGDTAVSAVVIHRLAEAGEITLPVKGVFIAIGLHANAGLVADLVELNDRGEVVVGADCSTSRPGLFAAGDVTSVYGKRIIIAAGEGAKAALAVKQYLVHQKAGKENHV